MDPFFVLEVDAFSPPFAWYETPEDVRYADESPLCPVCGAAVGGLYWLPPYRVILKHRRNVGDFVGGTGGADLLVSERFKKAYESEQMTGIERFIPIEIIEKPVTNPHVPRQLNLIEVEPDKTRCAPNVPPATPDLFGVYFKHSMTRVAKEEMGIEWMTQPEPDYCRTCGPGGGGKGGCFLSYDRVVVDRHSWTGEDFFIAINFPGTILLSERAKEFCERHQFTNGKIIPCEEARFSFF